jgi:hypothetical protein
MLLNLSLLSFGATDATAAEYVVTPSIHLQETYDDNVYFRNVDDFELLISPGLDLEARTEKGELKTSATWDISEYHRHNELDSVDQTYRLSAGLMPTDLYRLDFAGEYKDDYTFFSALEESGLLAERSRRKRATLQPGVVMALDPRNSLGVSYDFVKTQYHLERYSDYRVHGLNVTWAHDLMNERTSIICSVSGNQVDYDQTDGDTKQQTLIGLVGVDHEFSEALQVTLQAGARYTESEFTSGVLTVDDDDTGFVVDGTLGWRLERFTLSANVNRDFRPSIYGENTTRDRVRASLGYRFTEQFRGSLSTAYYRNETDGVLDEEKRQTYSVRPLVRYRFTEHIDLQLGYSYTWTENEITDNSEERNRIFVNLSMTWPKTID